jgi:protein ImuA
MATPDELGKLRARVRALEGGGTGLGREVARLGPALDPDLPWGGLPRAALHEVGGAAADTVALGLARAFLARGGVLAWCRDDRSARRRGELYGPGTAAFGIPPERLWQLRARAPAESLWAAAEALACPAVACTVLEVEALDLVAGRKLQLAAEAGGGAAILLRAGPADLAPSAALTRFRADPHMTSPAAPPREPRPVELALWRAKGAAPAAWTVIWNERTLAFDLASGLAARADGGLRAPAG